MINFRMLRLSDPLLWVSVGGLLLIGFLVIFSTTYEMQIKLGGDPLIFLKRQFLSLLVALGSLAFFAYLDYKHLKRASPYFYVITLVLLAVVLFAGSSGQGAQRWLQMGFFSFQPSEISKLAVIVALAAYLSEQRKLRNVWESFLLLLLVGIPFFLVFTQPDLGTAVVFLVILIGMLTVSEASPRLLLFLLIFLISVTPFIWGLLKPYQQQRITAFMNPAADPYGAGYHTLQSKIAIGSGGLLGKGFLRGTQTQLQFIPEQHSDFIFSAVGEEFGFVGAAVVLALFAIFVWRALTIASQARDPLGSLLAVGAAVMMGFHFLANVGMAVGLLPVVGIPLPFVSFGGSSLFMNLICVGILQSISMRRQKIIF